MSEVVDPWETSKILARIGASTRETPGPGYREVSFQAMGTQCRFVFGDPSAKPAQPARQGTPAERIIQSVLKWIAAFEAKYSRYWPASLVSKINQAAGREWTPVDVETDRILALCNDLHFLSRGAFDPTALPLLRLWDWKIPRPGLPGDHEIAAAKDLVGWRTVQRKPGAVFLPKPGMSLDLGGMGKEYAVDQIVLFLASAGVRSALVDFGADVRVLGSPPDGRPAWHVGLENPVQPGSCWTGIALKDAAVATSGDYRRNFERNGVRYGHIIDLRTGRPAAQGVLAASVIAPSCTQAGLLSTSSLILGSLEGIRALDASPGVAGALVTKSKTFPSHRFHEYCTV
jgi:FAD:protein FMN transferase